MHQCNLAEGEGFEPPRAWRPLRFSRAPIDVLSGVAGWRPGYESRPGCGSSVPPGTSPCRRGGVWWGYEPMAPSHPFLGRPAYSTPPGSAGSAMGRPQVTASRTAAGTVVWNCASGRAPSASLTVEKAILRATKVVMAKI
jgi:hypothetical protein